MMIGSGPAAIYSPPSFLTNHYLHFHYSYCSLHMPRLYRSPSFFFFPFSSTLPYTSLEEYAVLIGWRALINFQYQSPSPTHTYTLQRKRERERNEEDIAGIAVDVNFNVCARGQRGQVELKSVWAQRSRFSFLSLSRAMERRRRCDGDVQISVCFSSMLLVKTKLSTLPSFFFCFWANLFRVNVGMYLDLKKKKKEKLPWANVRRKEQAAG